MKELHTPGLWESTDSTEDFQGHFIFGNGRTIAATITQDACKCTHEELANGSLIVAAPAMLRALRQIAREADFLQEDGAIELGERLIGIVREAKAIIRLYEGSLFIRKLQRRQT